jgi:hypothetical protein
MYYVERIKQTSFGQEQLMLEIQQYEKWHKYVQVLLIIIVRKATNHFADQ